MFKTLCIWAENAQSWPFVKPCFGVLPAFWAILRLYGSKMAKRLVHETDIHSSPTSENCTKTRFFVQFGLFLGILRGFLDDLIPSSSSQFLGFWGLFPPILGQNRCFVHETDIHSSETFSFVGKNGNNCAITGALGLFWGCLGPIFGQKPHFGPVSNPIIEQKGPFLPTKLTFTPAKPSVSLAFGF